ncbi:MAG: cell division protein FtsQ [Elusimicrobia bacterium]|nr:cell division protein FtsQ [Elusimicrobiota bacterium]
MKRHRVRLRPKARAARRGTVGKAAGAGAVLAALALTMAARPWERVSLPRVGWGPLERAFSVEAVEFEGVPEGVARELEAAVGFTPGSAWSPVEAQRQSERLVERYAWIEQAAPVRSWLGKRVRFVVVPRGAVAAVTAPRRSGDGTAWLGEDGKVFSAPVGIVAGEGLPRVALAGWPEGADLAPTAALVRAVAAQQGFPAAAAAYSYDARERGWKVELADGTRILWGGTDWTGEKLSRLREVFADALPRLGPGFTADLRYFEDGRILVRP